MMLINSLCDCIMLVLQLQTIPQHTATGLAQPNLLPLLLLLTAAAHAVFVSMPELNLLLLLHLLLMLLLTLLFLSLRPCLAPRRSRQLRS